nr:reverse transcriptase domain, reverse transcriptase zinc-binding domain protein [Tanacetum cinerariifolium]
MQVRSLFGMDIIPPRLANVMGFLIPISKGRSVVNVVPRLLLAATSYYLWCERNSRLFKKKSSTVPQIIEVITAIVRLKLVTFKFKKVRVVLTFPSSRSLWVFLRRFFKEAVSSGPSAFLVLLLDDEECVLLLDLSFLLMLIWLFDFLAP